MGPPSYEGGRHGINAIGMLGKELLQWDRLGRGRKVGPRTRSTTSCRGFNGAALGRGRKVDQLDEGGRVSWCLSRPIKLQWGLPRSRAEGRRRGRTTRPFSRSFKGAPSYEGGREPQSSRRDRRHSETSLGPPSKEGGRRSVLAPLASLGRPPTRMEGCAEPAMRPFVTWLQWGGPRTRAEGRDVPEGRRAASMGPHSCASGCLPSCFNGAALLRGRKCSESCRPAGHRYRLASMGAPSYEGGSR